MNLKYRYIPDNKNNVNDIGHCMKIINKLSENDLNNLFFNTKISKNINMHEKLDERSNTLIKNNDISYTYISKGGQGVVYLINEKNCGGVVIKIIRNTNMKKINESTYNDAKIFGSSCEKKGEVYYTKECKKLIDLSICPNFLYTYDSIKTQSYTIIISEFINGTLEKWVEEVHSEYEWMSMLFQIVYGVYCIQKKMTTFHGDMKPKNIFYKKIDPSIVLQYKISDNVFDVYTKGYLFMISDFGHAIKCNSLNNKSLINLYIDQNKDLEHIVDLYKRILVSALIKMYTLDDIYKIIKDKKDIYFPEYLKKTKKDINNDLLNYPQHIKTKFLLKNICYYIVEKNYITDIPQKFQTMKLPSKNVIDFIKSWYGLSIVHIFDLFYEYFKLHTNKTNTQITTESIRYVV